MFIYQATYSRYHSRKFNIKIHLRKRILTKKIIFGALLLLTAVFGWSFLPSSPGKMTLIDQQYRQYSTTCPALINVKSTAPTDALNSTFSLLNWNIYKQQHQQWSKKLNEWANQADLITLQEAKYDQDLIHFSQQQKLSYYQNIAFNYQKQNYGVNTFSRVQAQQACGTRYSEPWTLVPKTGIATTYAFKDTTQSLLLVNLHGVNFTFTAEPLKEQVAPYIQLIEQHQGPIIISGDFNTWSEARTEEIIGTLVKAGFNETQFSKDQRLTILGLPLDHIFFRDLEMINAKSIATIASDHTPQLVTFSLLTKN